MNLSDSYHNSHSKSEWTTTHHFDSVEEQNYSKPCDWVVD